MANSMEPMNSEELTDSDDEPLQKLRQSTIMVNSMEPMNSEKLIDSDDEPLHKLRQSTIMTNSMEPMNSEELMESDDEPLQKLSQNKFLSGNSVHVMITETIDLKSKEMLDIEKDNSDSAILNLSQKCIDVKIKDSPNTDNEDHNLKSLGLVLSEPFSLRNVSIYDENSDVFNSTSNIDDEQFHIKDLTENLELYLPNSSNKLPSKNGESGNNEKDVLCVNKQDISVQSDKSTSDLSVNCFVGNTSIAEPRRSLRNASRKRRSYSHLIRKYRVKTNLPTSYYVGNTVDITREKNIPAKQNISTSNKSCIVKTDNRVKKLKPLTPKNKVDTLFEIKPCSIIVEKNIANQMRPPDVCKVIQKDNLDSFIVHTKPQQNPSPSELNTDVYIPPIEEYIPNKIDCTESNNSTLSTCEENDLNDRSIPTTLSTCEENDLNDRSIPTTLSTCKENYLNDRSIPTILSTCEENDLNDKFIPTILSTCEESDLNDRSIQTILSTCKENDLNNRSMPTILSTYEENDLKDRSIPISLDPAKESESEIDDSVEDSEKIVSTQDVIKKNYSKIMMKKPIAELSDLLIFRKRIFRKRKKTNEIKNPESGGSSLTQIMQSLKNNKALTIEPVPNLVNKPEVLLSRTGSNESCTSTLVDNKFINESIKFSSENISKIPVSGTKIQLNPNISCSSTLNENKFTTGTSKVLSKAKSKKPTPKTKTQLKVLSEDKSKKPTIKNKTRPKFEDMLDRAPPFIQEVFKCDNIRDGFINEDLLFVLRLFPDMEEMGDADKLKFQLRVIETINDVLADPLLKS